MAVITNMAVIDTSSGVGVVADEEFTYREDLKRAGGWDVRLDQNAKGPHVREAIMLRDMPFWRDWGVSALVFRFYEDEEITVAEGAWMEKKKK